ncbi:RNA 2',3'-cyclic phosphodiesterase [Sphingomonas sp. PR090111-T3T-6A]|uniref:RNA 2',3'-cyclic phosphodiesterase n=1 Tax=Sphingomonas sp. PR090111-T3T-6A TaxID=685778 RepID=UPI00037C5AA1|nr:RNA 2',3'-cyclic phosphodiesterase [Sphingomonas sp. PR090111-T3T-6A]
MAHHRLFVAIRPPAPVCAALLRVMGGVPGARWQDDAQLHITLRFIGEVDRHQAEDIAALLGHVRHPGFSLTLAESGTFERNGRVDALWIGVSPRDRIKALHGKIDRMLAQAGVAPDSRAFLPHITLARFARSAAPPPGAAAGIVPPPLDPFAVTSFELFESHLGSEGAIYDTVARYLLDPPEA